MTAVVRFDAVSKRYRKGRERSNVRALLPGNLGERRRGDFHWALRDLSFSLEPGRSIGIIGPNGAGKSTTLKLVAGVIEATSGDVEVHGRTTSLIELGAGFHADMTGRENVLFSAAVLGMRPKEIRDRFDEIIDFAGIGSFLDTPVKRYSSGMMARLGFAIASHVDAQVVVLDEVLAVGDAQFQGRCHERIQALRDEGAALVYVTHALWTVPVLCDEAILLVEGGAGARGNPADVLRAYESSRNVVEPQSRPLPVLASVEPSASIINSGDPITLDIELDLHRSYPDAQILVQLVAGGDQLYATVTTLGTEVRFEQGSQRITCTVPSMPLQPGPYHLAVSFFTNHAFPVVDDALLVNFEVQGPSVNPRLGSLTLPVAWESRRT